MEIPAAENLFILESHFSGKIYHKFKTYVQLFQWTYKSCDRRIVVRL